MNSHTDYLQTEIKALEEVVRARTRALRTIRDPAKALEVAADLEGAVQTLAGAKAAVALRLATPKNK